MRHDGCARLKSASSRQKGQLAQGGGVRTRSSRTRLREAREHIGTLRDEVDKLSQPPSAYGVVVGKN